MFIVVRKDMGAMHTLWLFLYFYLFFSRMSFSCPRIRLILIEYCNFDSFSFGTTICFFTNSVQNRSAILIFFFMSPIPLLTMLFQVIKKIFCLDKPWLDLQYNGNKKAAIKNPNELAKEMEEPPGPIDEDILNRIQGSMIGMALGDALGAHVEFRPRQYMVEHPVTDLKAGGTWGLQKGQVLLIRLTS